EEIPLGPQADAEIALPLAGTLVLDGVRADVFDRGLQPAIDAVVIGIEFHRRFLADLDEPAVGGANLGLDQQGVLDRHDLHEIFARLDDAADGADLDLLDRPAHGRTDLGTRYLVLAALELLDHARLLEALLAEFGGGLRAEGQLLFTDRVLGFLFRRPL